MRIAVVTGLFPVLSETPFLNQVTGLVERGQEVEVYADQPQPGVPHHPDFERLGLDRVTHYPITLPAGTAARWAAGLRLIRAYHGAERRALLRSLNPFVYWRRALSLGQLRHTASFLPRREYDICYCTFGQDAVKALRARRAGALGGRLVTAFRGADLTRYVTRRGARVYRRLFREGDLFLPVSDAFARRLARLGCPTSRTVVHRTGIDLSRWPFRPREAGPDGVLRLVSVGRLVEKKGIADALRAVRGAADAGVTLEYDIIGGGPLRAPLERLAGELGLGGRVRFRGWQSQAVVREALDRAHVLAAPSLVAGDGDEEGIPNVLKEAMASGLPVLATRHSGIPELVEDGVSGFLVAERDPEALAARLGWLAAHPERWAAMGRAGRATIERDYDIARLNDRLLGLFHQLTHSRTGHR